MTRYSTSQKNNKKKETIHGRSSDGTTTDNNGRGQVSYYSKLNHGGSPGNRTNKTVSFEDEVGECDNNNINSNERAPLLFRQDPPPPPPPPLPNNGRHNRTRSVGASGNFFGATVPPPKASPKQKQHSRTRSLEEWANMFGINGITDPDPEYGKKHRYDNGVNGSGVRLSIDSTEAEPEQSQTIVRSNNDGSDDSSNRQQQQQQDYYQRNPQFSQRSSRQKPPLAPKSS